MDTCAKGYEKLCEKLFNISSLPEYAKKSGKLHIEINLNNGGIRGSRVRLETQGKIIEQTVVSEISDWVNI